MKIKYIVGVILMLIGAFMSLKGATDSNQNLVNLGIGGIFLGTIVLTFSTTEYVKYDAVKAMISPYIKDTSKLIKNLELKNKAVIIPPYENMENGGVFIPLHADFNLDLARLDNSMLFATYVGGENEMGVILSAGCELLGMYENYAEMDFSGTDIKVVESVVSSVLRTLNLANSVEISEKDEELRIYVEGLKFANICNTAMEGRVCECAPCPLCSSILISLAKSSGELVAVQGFNLEDTRVEIISRKIGGIEKWM